MGGAESMLLRIAGATRSQGVLHQVVVLTGGGPLTEQLGRLGITATCLGLPLSVTGMAQAAVALRRHLGRRPADVIQTWMYSADLVGSLCWLLGCRLPLVWNIRHSTLDAALDSRATRWSAAALARLSPFVPSYVLCNSKCGWTNHFQAGYRPARLRIIPNGFDLGWFKPRRESRQTIRHMLQVDAHSPLIGMVGRFHPLKNPLAFVQLAGRVACHRPDVHFVMIGRGLSRENSELTSAVERSGVQSHLHLVGPQDDTARWMAALDLLILPSRSEGFPNVIGEAMACGVPCVATAVGDVCDIVGETGWIVDRPDPELLARCTLEFLQLDPHQRAERSMACRQRIAQNYDIGRIAREYVDVWRDAAGMEK
jgi:glycosyltransferase involved in cell wall biosynthesis